MKKGNLKNRSVLATLVFASALLGLFFSKAEGISLLPFPNPTAVEQGGSLENLGSQNNYNQSLTSTRTAPSKRSATKAPLDDGAGSPVLPSLRLSPSLTPRNGERIDRESLFYTGNSTGNRPGRGPPLA